MFDEVLYDSDRITDYIVEFSTEYIDIELVREYFMGKKAYLKKVAISTLNFHNPDNHLRSRQKEKKYKKLLIETMPPLIVENSIVIDGNHRLRTAIAKNEKEIFIYEII